jgi:hypothetical protein
VVNELLVIPIQVTRKTSLCQTHHVHCQTPSGPC